MDFKNRRVTIVGLGLMGGSIALELQGRCAQLLGVDNDLQAAKLAQQAGVEIADFDSAVEACDVLVLATPARETLQILDRLQTDPPQVELLIDLASTKRLIVEKMHTIPHSVGGHPLCGKASSGFRAAEIGLFDGHPFILSRTAQTTQEAADLAQELVLLLGATPRFMDAGEHDRLLAVASHLPYLMAVALMRVAEDLGKIDPAVWETTVSGFLGATRLVASDLKMMVDILITNRDMALSALGQAKNSIESLEELVAIGEPEAVLEFLTPLRERRLALNPQRERVNEA